MFNPQNPINNNLNLTPTGQKFQAFANQMNGQNPEQIVRNLMQNGQMSQDQFNKFAQMANKLTGR